MLTKKQETKLNRMLSNVGDVYFKRCITTILHEIDIKPGERLLDAGCGEGFYSMLISNLFDCDITAIDNGAEILTAARKRFGKNTKVTLEKQNLLKLPYPKKYFDNIICSEVLEHIENDAKVMQELNRVLKPGGHIYITVPNENYSLLWDPINKVRGALGLGHFSPMDRFLGGVWALGHKRLYSVGNLEKLVEDAKFRIEKTKLLTKYVLPFNLLILNLGKVFYTSLPNNKGTRNAMEKFEWEAKEKTKKQSLGERMVSIGKNLIEKIDRLNDKKTSKKDNSVGIFLKAQK
jgi:ubiquinone/menaquinone biosynthesis C-methylase UbiE